MIIKFKVGCWQFITIGNDVVNNKTKNNVNFFCHL